MWKIELRKNCKICGDPLPNARFRTFCSTKCRIKAYNKKRMDSGYYKEWKVKHSQSPCPDTDIVV